MTFDEFEQMYDEVVWAAEKIVVLVLLPISGDVSVVQSKQQLIL